MNTHVRLRQAGFTLVELLVVVLIIGVLSAVMIPQYNKTVEVSKADDAAAIVAMIGQANRMFQIDNNTYVSDGDLVDGMSGTTCVANPTNVSQLVACRYLADRRWSGLAYTYRAGKTVTCGLPAPPGIACAKRDSAAQAPFSTWGYVMSGAGVVKCYRNGGEDTTCNPK